MDIRGDYNKVMENTYPSSRANAFEQFVITKLDQLAGEIENLNGRNPSN